MADTTPSRINTWKGSADIRNGGRASNPGIERLNDENVV
jgi:hypothetical protein